MGTVGDALDNAIADPFFASLHCELLEAFYNPTRRHSTLGCLGPVDYEAAGAA